MVRNSNFPDDVAVVGDGTLVFNDATSFRLFYLLRFLTLAHAFVVIVIRVNELHENKQLK